MRIYKHIEEIPKQINPTGLKLQPVVGNRDFNFACEFAKAAGKEHSYGTRSVPTTYFAEQHLPLALLANFDQFCQNTPVKTM